MKVRRRAIFITRDGVASSSLRSSLSLTCQWNRLDVATRSRASLRNMSRPEIDPPPIPHATFWAN